ncbi:unnamed protein product [Durusdinium trenchii]|uniref:Uncharacterized protein n=1 Tax=Durusdinium trenchii TaxID=1381693 RepID=A0ABP0M6P5_9DINO
MAQDWAAYAAALQALAPAQMGLTGQAAPAAPTLPSLPAVAQHPPAAPLADAATIAAAVALLQPQIAGGAGYGALRSASISSPPAPYGKAPSVNPCGAGIAAQVDANAALSAIPGLDPATLAAIAEALGNFSSAPAQATGNLQGLQGLDLNLAGLANSGNRKGVGPAPNSGGLLGPRPPRNPPGVIGRRPRPKAVPAPLPALREEDVANSYALLEAAEARDEGRCRALVQHPNFRHVNQKTKEGRTALHLVMLKKLPEDLCLAIAKHKDFNEVNAVDTFGYTQLILAASKGMSQVCKAILDRDDFVGINAQDKWGATALHWAADQDLAEVCEKILSHPEFVEGNRRAWSFAFEDKTALDVALNRNCKAAAEVIRKHVGPR